MADVLEGTLGGLSRPYKFHQDIMWCLTRNEKFTHAEYVCLRSTSTHLQSLFSGVWIYSWDYTRTKQYSALLTTTAVYSTFDTRSHNSNLISETTFVGSALGASNHQSWLQSICVSAASSRFGSSRAFRVVAGINYASSNFFWSTRQLNTLYVQLILSISRYDDDC